MLVAGFSVRPIADRHIIACCSPAAVWPSNQTLCWFLLPLKLHFDSYLTPHTLKGRFTQNQDDVSFVSHEKLLIIPSSSCYIYSAVEFWVPWFSFYHRKTARSWRRGLRSRCTNIKEAIFVWVSSSKLFLWGLSSVLKQFVHLHKTVKKKDQLSLVNCSQSHITKSEQSAALSQSDQYAETLVHTADLIKFCLYRQPVRLVWRISALLLLVVKLINKDSAATLIYWVSKSWRYHKSLWQE